MELLLLTPGDASDLIGTRTRAARRQHGWTQAELSERAGVSVATVARLEGRGIAQLSNFLRILSALGRLGDVDALLQVPKPRTMDELRRLS